MLKQICAAAAFCQHIINRCDMRSSLKHILCVLLIQQRASHSYLLTQFGVIWSNVVMTLNNRTERNRRSMEPVSEYSGNPPGQHTHNNNNVANTDSSARSSPAPLRRMSSHLSFVSQLTNSLRLGNEIDEFAAGQDVPDIVGPIFVPLKDGSCPYLW